MHLFKQLLCAYQSLLYLIVPLLSKNVKTHQCDILLHYNKYTLSCFPKYSLKHQMHYTFFMDL